MQRTAIVGGLGLPGYLITMGLLRQGVRVLACDPKQITGRTLSRVYGLADECRPKVAGLARAADDLGRRELLQARRGRLEDEIGGLELREAGLVFLAADRPSATRRIAEICLQAATPAHPIRLVTCNVSEGAAQVRSYLFPLAGTACPMCGAGAAYLSSVLTEFAEFSCDEAGTREGDLFTVDFGSAEGYAAAGLALTAATAPAGGDTTLSLPALRSYTSKLSQADDCPLRCSEVPSWPEVCATVDYEGPLAPALRELAQQVHLDGDEIAVRFLRPIHLGTECGCGVQHRLRMSQGPCRACGTLVVPQAGLAYGLTLDELAHYEDKASAVSMGLPVRDLLLLSDRDGNQVTVATTAAGGAK